MTAVVARGKARVGSWFGTARERSGAFDHMVRAYQRFNEQKGNSLAGAVTYFGFLSFFPLLAVAFAILVYIVMVYPDARAQVQHALQATFPGLIGSGPGKIDLSRTSSAGIGAGIIGLAGLIYSGTGWIDALRDALRSMWLQPVHKAPNIVVKKLWDLVVLVAFGVALVASVSFSGLATSATRVVLHAVGLSQVTGMGVLVRILAVVVAVAFDSVVFALLYGVLPGVRTPLRTLLRGAVLGAAMFEVLKLVGTWLIGRTTSNPVYGAFAIMVGLLIWINFVSRITLLAAAWTATGIPEEPSAGEEDELPGEVAERLDSLPFARLHRPLDYEALRYREEDWLADRADKADWPVGERGRIRAIYMHEIAERARAAGIDQEVVAPEQRPGSLRDLAHQVRVARLARSRRYR
ncbi:MAG TPA: YihY/virulence factor BrkB family protein [Streptosporangiales bacterium]